jgi:hypothetical protein
LAIYCGKNSPIGDTKLDIIFEKQNVKKRIFPLLYCRPKGVSFRITLKAGLFKVQGIKERPVSYYT